MSDVQVASISVAQKVHSSRTTVVDQSCNIYLEDKAKLSDCRRFECKIGVGFANMLLLYLSPCLEIENVAQDNGHSEGVERVRIRRALPKNKSIGGSGRDAFDDLVPTDLSWLLATLSLLSLS